MKKVILNFAGSIILLLAGTCITFAQMGRYYKDRPLWQMQFVQTTPEMTDLSLKNLSANRRKEISAAKEAGLIMDYKVLWSQPSRQDGWDLLLMYETKNHAALENTKDKIEAVNKKIFGSEVSMQFQGMLSVYQKEPV